MLFRLTDQVDAEDDDHDGTQNVGGGVVVVVPKVAAFASRIKDGVKAHQDEEDPAPGQDVLVESQGWEKLFPDELVFLLVKFLVRAGNQVAGVEEGKEPNQEGKDHEEGGQADQGWNDQDREEDQH